MPQFETKVDRFTGTGTWTYCTIPGDMEKLFGSKGQIRIKGKINNFSFHARLMPHGDGRHFLILNESIRKGAGIKVGDTISVTIQKDASSPEPEIPDELKKALMKNKTAAKYFNSLAPSHKKEYIGYITEAKKPETRMARIEKTTQKLAEMAKKKI